MYPTANETALWVALNHTQRSLYRAMDAALKDNNLPRLRWYDILWAIERADTDGLRPFELEKALLFEQSNLSRLLHRMTVEGLLQETVFQDDHRGKVFRITEKGRRIRKQMWTIYGPMIHASMSQHPKGHNINTTTAALYALTADGIEL